MMWINGEPCSQLSAQDRGLLYGDGLWETLPVTAGQPQLLQAHMKRLQTGLDALAIRADSGAIAQQARDLAQPYTSAVMKIMVTRGIGQRGYNPTTATTPTLIIDINEREPLTAAAHKQQQHGIQVGICQHTRLGAQPLLAGFKHLNRLEQVLARAEMHDEWQEALVQDYAGNIIEGTMSNVFFLLPDTTWVTPDLSQCGIAGVMREQVLAAFHVMHIRCAVRNVSLEEAQRATGLFMCNSLVGIWPVCKFSGQTLTIPAMVRELQTRMKSYL